MEQENLTQLVCVFLLVTGRDTEFRRFLQLLFPARHIIRREIVLVRREIGDDEPVVCVCVCMCVYACVCVCVCVWERESGVYMYVNVCVHLTVTE